MLIENQVAWLFNCNELLLRLLVEPLLDRHCIIYDQFRAVKTRADDRTEIERLIAA